MSRKKLIGTIIWWSVRKNCGTILVNRFNAPPDRYFLHGSSIVKGPIPKVGSTVCFFVSPVPPQPDRLAAAVAAEIFESNLDGAAILSGRSLAGNGGAL